MRIAAFSHVEMTVDPARASAELLLKTPPLQALLLIAFSTLGMAILLTPLGLIAADAATNPQVFNTLGEHIGSSLLLAAGVAVGLVLLAYPLRAGLARLGGRTKVRLADGQVFVERRGVLRSQNWSAPLSQFCGVTHHIRATLSGARHEIILVHPDPAKDVLLNLGSRHPKEGADHFAYMLGMAEVQPRTLYQRRRVPAQIDAASELRAQAA